MVLARETSAADLQAFLQADVLEAEVFVHGALCVSHSGQCLFSSLVGGRSGNRGECAQPCRLPDARGRYPLSLKDLCLAQHIPALIEMGVHSLKIEGRLKSPAYVREVTAAWRRLLDERRAATDKEMAALAAVFSRGGFTDAYFSGKTGKKMMGFRSDEDKESSRTLQPFDKMTRTVPLDMELTMRREQPLSLTVKTASRTATVVGEPPLIAERAPMDKEAVKRNLCKLGGTPYTPKRVEILLDEGLMVPLSRLNALRRAALERLTAIEREIPQKVAPLPTQFASFAKEERVGTPTARFEQAAQITEKALATFEIRYLPLHAFAPPANGVILPPVIFDHELENVQKALHVAAKCGAKHALIGNVGHLSLALEAGLVPHADFRLNVTNAASLAVLREMGFADALLSPELSLPQIRDLRGRCDAIVYGRIPLMLLEKCAGLEVGSCELCAKGQNALVDRRGERFPLLRTPDHRNILLNSRPTVMSDRRAELLRAGICGGHYIFTTENAAEVDLVLEAYRLGTPLTGNKRRI
ncbi:MAG: U32 family peptidase [Clostridia bacterium]|nr:U32 family peptidase [Clostridia bacterium]